MKLNVNELYDAIIDDCIASKETVDVVTDINGYSVDTLNDIIYTCTGYRYYGQWDNDDDQ